jgi:amino-acid N-acetyltransferase
MTPLPIGFSAEVENLLTSCSLPATDLSEELFLNLFGLHDTGDLIGVVGVELYGSEALLRSLAVQESFRRKGLGRKLVAHAESWAFQQGVSRLYLLTTTAEQLFTQLGYEVIPRSMAPTAIKDTSQFSGLCPSSSTFMRKLLTGVPG